MKNKIIKFIKENWYFIFLLIPFLSFCVANKTPDNDIWFILNNGRYVLSHGIPHIDPFTIHEGLHYVMQQWLSSIIFYGVYKIFGKYGLLLLMFLLFWLLTFILYKLCYLISDNKKISVAITSIVIFAVSYDFLITRPQIFTYIILLLETYLLELYIKNNNKKLLIPLPLLSLLLMNMHCSMWFFQFIFLLPFIVNGLNIKGLTIKKINIKPILVVMIIMFLVGFINPYGLEAITFIFKTYGIKGFNALIGEMQPTDSNYYPWKYCLLGVLFLIFCLNYNKKTKLDIRFLLFIFGTFILAAMHKKCVVYFLIWSGYGMSSLKLNISIKNKIIKRFIDTSLITIAISLLIITIPTIVLLIENYDLRNPRMETIVKYIQKNYNKEDVKLYINYNEGGYTEFMGYKSYIDSRAEVFIYQFNKKEDIFAEGTNITKNPSDASIKKFLKKYNFTHIIVPYNNSFEKYLNEKTDYVNEYTKYFDERGELPLTKLYVRKDISVLKNKEKSDKNEKIK